MDPISVVKTAAGVASVRPEHYEGDVELGARLPPANRQGRTALIVRGEAPRFPDALCAAQIHNLSLMSYALTGVHISDGQSIRAAVTHLLRKNRAYHDRVRIRTAAVRQGSVWTLVWCNMRVYSKLEAPDEAPALDYGDAVLAESWIEPERVDAFLSARRRARSRWQVRARRS